MITFSSSFILLFVSSSSSFLTVKSLLIPVVDVNVVVAVVNADDNDDGVDVDEVTTTKTGIGFLLSSDCDDNNSVDDPTTVSLFCCTAKAALVNKSIADLETDVAVADVVVTVGFCSIWIVVAVAVVVDDGVSDNGCNCEFEIELLLLLLTLAVINAVVGFIIFIIPAVVDVVDNDDSDDDVLNDDNDCGWQITTRDKFNCSVVKGRLLFVLFDGAWTITVGCCIILGVVEGDGCWFGCCCCCKVWISNLFCKFVNAIAAAVAAAFADDDDDAIVAGCCWTTVKVVVAGVDVMDDDDDDNDENDDRSNITLVPLANVNCCWWGFKGNVSLLLLVIVVTIVDGGSSCCCCCCCWLITCSLLIFSSDIEPGLPGAERLE